MSRKVIFLDRDGTLIVNKHYLNSVEGIEYLPGVFEGLQYLKSQGYEFVMVTNQSGIPRGLVTEQQLNDIHSVMETDLAQKGLEFLKIYFAPHLPESNHPNRKPNPGMLFSAKDELNIDMKQCWMIGDSEADILAGKNAGLPSILIAPTPLQNETLNFEFHHFESWPEIEKFFRSQFESSQ